jgi:hypothetical protein
MCKSWWPNWRRKWPTMPASPPARPWLPTKAAGRCSAAGPARAAQTKAYSVILKSEDPTGAFRMLSARNKLWVTFVQTFP